MTTPSTILSNQKKEARVKPGLIYNERQVKKLDTQICATCQKYCVLLSDFELSEVIDALFLAAKEWGEPSRSRLAAIAFKIRAEVIDEKNRKKCNAIIKEVF